MPSLAPLRSVLLTLLCTLGFLLVLAAPAVSGIPAALFLLLAALVQTVLLSTPVLLLHALYVRGQRRGRASPLLAAAVHVAALLTLLFLVANYKLQQMFGFYFNYFVLNLLLTPGGVEAMGVSTGVDIHRLIAAREPLKAGLPGEPLYGMTPEAGLPKGWAGQCP